MSPSSDVTYVRKRHARPGGTAVPSALWCYSGRHLSARARHPLRSLPAFVAIFGSCDTSVGGNSERGLEERRQSGQPSCGWPRTLRLAGSSPRGPQGVWRPHVSAHGFAAPRRPLPLWPPERRNPGAASVLRHSPYSVDPRIEQETLLPGIQGEGALVGERPVFFRLSGCNIR